MDQIKIGIFIASMRKKQGMTQKQLADQINVTDKTVSKWETGYRMPDASFLLELSSVLKVDINELLAGEEFSSEEFSSEEYLKKSESNIVCLVSELNEIDKKNKSRSFGMIVGILAIGMAFLHLFGLSLRMGRIIDIFDWPTLLYLSGLQFVILSISGSFHDYLNAWRTCLPRKKISEGELPERELELAIQAVKYAGALVLALGCLLSLVSSFSLLNYMDASTLIWPALAQIVLILLYTAIEETVYVILVFRMKRVLHGLQIKK